MAIEIEELDLVSAIWILASNDENSIITYEGIRYRLGLPEGTDVRAIVKQRPELFRHGVSQVRLKEWRDLLLQGKQIPSWVRDINDQEEQTRTIKGITVDDVFRSQFRADRNAARSPIEIITWGLEHLDRLRKARLEAKDVSAKSWQIWLVFVIGVLGLLVQLLIAYFKAPQNHG